MAHSFIAFIDESGDDGLGNPRQQGRSGGQSRWLVISCVLTRQTNTLDMVRWRDEILALMPDKKKRELKFSQMNHGQKLASVRSLQHRPIRISSVLSNKQTIPDGVYDGPAGKNRLYFYLTRHLIERISWMCRNLRPNVPEGDGRVKITFSRRGGLSYEGFRSYLHRLRDVDDGDVNIHWPVIDIEGIDAQDHSRNASLQIADNAASAFSAGVEPDLYGNCESRYAAELKKVTYNRDGNFLSYGVKMLPRYEEMEPLLNQDQKAFVALFK